MTILTFSLSQAVYRGDYRKNVQGKMIPTDKTVDLERAYNANKIQSEVNKKALGSTEFVILKNQIVWF